MADPARTAKFPAVPSPTGASAAFASEPTISSAIRAMIGKPTPVRFKNENRDDVLSVWLIRS
jgi:hypothetical protein